MEISAEASAKVEHIRRRPRRRPAKGRRRPAKASDRATSEVRSASGIRFSSGSVPTTLCYTNPSVFPMNPMRARVRAASTAICLVGGGPASVAARRAQAARPPGDNPGPHTARGAFCGSAYPPQVTGNGGAAMSPTHPPPESGGGSLQTTLPWLAHAPRASNGLRRPPRASAGFRRPPWGLHGPLRAAVGLRGPAPASTGLRRPLARPPAPPIAHKPLRPMSAPSTAPDRTRSRSGETGENAEDGGNSEWCVWGEWRQLEC